MFPKLLTSGNRFGVCAGASMFALEFVGVVGIVGVVGVVGIVGVVGEVGFIRLVGIVGRLHSDSLEYIVLLLHIDLHTPDCLGR